MTSSAHAEAPAVNPAVDAAGGEGLNPNHHQIEEVTTMMTRLTAHSDAVDYHEDLGTWSHRVPLEDVRSAHTAAHAKLHGPVVRTWPGVGEGVTNVTFEDGHAIYYRETPVDTHPDEHYREDPVDESSDEIVTAMCPLRTCDVTYTGTSEYAGEWHYQHSHKHKAMADVLKIETLAEFNIVDESSHSGVGGLSGALELHTDHGLFGEPTISKHHILIDKAIGSNDLPSIPAEMLPELISELQRLNGIYTRRVEAGL